MTNEMKSVSLEEVSNIIMGQSPDSEYYNEEGYGYPFLQGCANFTSKYPRAEIFCSVPSKIAPKDSILISVRAPVGELNLSDREYCIGRGLASIVPTNIDVNYLFYSISLNKRDFNRVSQGSTFDAINSQDLRHFAILVPNDDRKQRRISEVLLNMDRTIEKTEQVILKYKNIKQGLIQDMLSGRIRFSDGKIVKETKFRDSEIGLIPLDKSICSVKTYIKFQKSGLSRRITTEDIGIPVLTSGNIIDSKLNVEELKYWFIDDPQGASVEDYILNDEDILLCFINSVEQMGKVCIFYDIGRPCIYTTNLFRIKASEYAIPQFLFYLLESFYVQREVKKITKPAINQASFTKEDFLKIKVPFYELEEQREIVKMLSCADSKIEKELSFLNKLNQIKQGLMQDLLTGKVRVRVEEDGDE